jgi:hypothetical protein
LLPHPGKRSETVFVFIMSAKWVCLLSNTELAVDLVEQLLCCLLDLLQVSGQILISVRHFVLLRRRFDMQPRAVSRPEKEHRGDLDYWSRSINPRLFDIAEAKAMQRPIDFLTSYVERQLAWSKGIDRSQDLLMLKVKEDFVELPLDCISALEHKDARRVRLSVV